MKHETDVEKVLAGQPTEPQVDTATPPKTPVVNVEKTLSNDNGLGDGHPVS